MFAVLLVICAFYSIRTLQPYHPTGMEGARAAAREVAAAAPARSAVIVAAGTGSEDRIFTRVAARELEERGYRVYRRVNGSPSDLRGALLEAKEEAVSIAAIAADSRLSRWPLMENLAAVTGPHEAPSVHYPGSYPWPTFLRKDNLLNVANQIVVIAILAIGMTFVIITGGIDLSVGSLVALSAVAGALLIRDFGGGEEAGILAMLLAAMAAIALCGAMGLFSGAMVTFCAIPPFIVTLGIMLVASGLAYLLSEGQSIYQLPRNATWLGRGHLFSIPVAVLLMALLYGIAHFLMRHTILGRHIYAVGGNQEAARLSGVPVRRVLLFVYTAGGALAGLGGIITASQLRSGSPQYGLMYELYVIAAVVVGGASLSGGEGRVLGTLIGAFIIAVIQNGMNLTGVESYTQKVVFGLVILGAVLLDSLKKNGRSFLSRYRTPRPA